MRKQFVIWVLGLLVVALALAGCGASTSSPLSSTTPAIAGQSAAPSPAAAGGQSDLHGPPDNWEAHPPIHVHRAALAHPAGYSPAQMRHAYGFDQLAGTGAGQVIAIVDAYGSPTIQSDLNTFDTKFSLPATTVQIQYPAAKVGKADGGWALETSLDVEWAHAIAPAATILLVVSPSAGNTPLLSCVDYAAAHAS